ncbi:MAG: transposase family protein [Cyanobacteria bacterium P01_A01_bin.84]
MNYEKVRNRASQFESVTSLTVEEFDTLLPVFETYLKRSLCYTTRGTIRLNKLNYPSSLPSAAHILFFTLSYLKLNPLQEQHGASFDMSQESVSYWFRIGEKSLNAAMKKGGYTPHRDGSTLKNVLERKINNEPKEDKSDGEHYFIDASDRDIQRPNNKEEQEEKYSGKQHRHTIKNTCISNEKSEILYLGQTFSGQAHDKKMADEELLTFPDGCFLWKDLGYQGYLPENVHSFEPYKKPKGGELTNLQKQENQLIASIRIVVEHAIGGMKRCRIVKDTIRIYASSIRDRVVETCAALHNFRLSQRKGYKQNVLFNPITTN